MVSFDCLQCVCRPTSPIQMRISPDALHSAVTERNFTRFRRPRLAADLEHEAHLRGADRTGRILTRRNRRRPTDITMTIIRDGHAWWVSTAP
jgi:hypothetical protein